MNTEHIDMIITTLKIVGMVKKNQKLCVRKGQLTIEKEDKLQFVRRWVHNDSRDTIIMHLKNVMNNAIKVSEHLLMESAATAGAGNDRQIDEWTLNLVTTEMENMQHGLVNLKTTYADDPIMIANIDVMLDRITINREKNQIKLDS